MAFKDANGRITIDDVAAHKDIVNLSASYEKLSSAQSAMNLITNSAESYKGESIEAIFEAANQIKAKIEALMNAIEESKSQIEKTVAKYQRIDAEVRDTINSSL